MTSPVLPTATAHSWTTSPQVIEIILRLACVTKPGLHYHWWEFIAVLIAHDVKFLS